MRTRFIFAILAAVAIAGCSGGGGLGPGTQNNNTQATQQEIGQAGTEAGLAPLEQGSLQVGLLNGNMGVPLSTSRSPLSTFAASPTGACNNGIEYTVTVISPTQTQYETKYFYDKACVSLAKDVVALITINSPSSENIVRTAKSYNLAGLLLSTRNTNYSITGAPGNYSAVLTGDILIGTSSSPVVQFGHQFTIAPQSSNVFTIAANSGKVVNNGNPNINESFGHMGVLTNGTATIDGSSNITFAGSHAGTFFKGPLGSLTLSSTPPFTVSGGTQLGTNNVSGSVEFDKYGNIVGVSITGTLWNGDSINVSSTGTPPGVSINGSITTPSGANVATFQVDQNGNGIITYANGQQALIYDWHVVR
ncbi:MAG TPA: hypothetical protein VGW96_04550 [Candidatus Eremiobacteraceae bacterium]|nr:hypothetical protein [Candidatus Eremiobacteraceae bacterium]